MPLLYCTQNECSRVDYVLFYFNFRKTFRKFLNIPVPNAEKCMDRRVHYADIRDHMEVKHLNVNFATRSTTESTYISGICRSTREIDIYARNAENPSAGIGT